jgi:putative transposase
MNKSNKFSPEVRERAVRMVLEHRGEYPSLWAAMASIAPKIGCVPQTPHERVKQAEVDTAARHDGRSAAHQGSGARGEGAAPRQRDPQTGQRVFRTGGARPPTQVVRDFIDTHLATHGVEPICKLLQVATSGYYRYAALRRDPQRRCGRALSDEALAPQIERVWQANLQVYGADKVWRQLAREGTTVARCTVERLMGRLGLHGAVRGKRVRTTIRDSNAACPLDKVNRQFRAEQPNQLWVSGFTYVSTWQGWLNVAFVIDVFARRILGWHVSSSMRNDFVLEALEQALYARQPEADNTLIHHSDRGSQYLSIRYSERLAQAGIEPSVGSTGDSYDNALAETINGLYKTGLIHRRAPWRTREAVELATLEWVAWFNHHRLLEPIGYIPPAEAEANYYRQLANQAAVTA